MTTTRLLLAAAISTLLVVGAGCATPCEELAAKICSCQPTTATRDACERRANQQKASNPPGNAGEKRCEALLETCDCHALDTAAGKRACGEAE
ncbi:hypothetical protein [Vulgatibacter incomptus]|uniref:Lipoprotein n=1 Tax=Vulgatibacter incomptus TaxID=1391653 RepID=A0A0K1PFZ5_9BACT|nr:hypothetical protein [Vulgatibacter incomptus]AKU92427.1 hypothetical protein AKJ08_2814 [Vulgatibacter incomptus]